MGLRIDLKRLGVTEAEMKLDSTQTQPVCSSCHGHRAVVIVLPDLKAPATNPGPSPIRQPVAASKLRKQGLCTVFGVKSHRFEARVRFIVDIIKRIKTW